MPARRAPGFMWQKPARVRLLAAAFALVAAAPLAPAVEPTTETIVFVRHGEKPALGLGQLTCQGLNRALALPAVIARAFGKPDFIFAPNPADQKEDLGRRYDYVRPLATIEPTAIVFGLPVNTNIGVSAHDALQRTLEDPIYRSALVLVGWEHSDIVKIARGLMSDHGGQPAIVPDWKWSDFDSIYVIRISRAAETTNVTFDHRQEGLDGQPTNCPGQPAPQ